MRSLGLFQTRFVDIASVEDFNNIISTFSQTGTRESKEKLLMIFKWVLQSKDNEEKIRNMDTLYTMLHHYTVMSNATKKVTWQSFNYFLDQRLKIGDDLHKEILKLMADMGLLTFHGTIDQARFDTMVAEFKQTADPDLNKELLTLFVKILASRNNEEKKNNKKKLFADLYKYVILGSSSFEKVNLETFENYISSVLFEGEGSRARIVKLMEDLGLIENQGLEKKVDGSYSKKEIDRLLDNTLHPAQEA